MPIEFNIGTRG